MQLNCNGLLTVAELAKKNNGFRKQGGKGNLNSQILGEEKCETHTLVELKKFLCRTDPLFSSHTVFIRGTPNWVKWYCLVIPSPQNWSFPHLPNLTKLGSIVHFHCLHHLICGYWRPICMVQYRDSHTWGKYCSHFMDLDLYGKGQVNKKLHGPFCSSMIDFLILSMDLGGTATYSMNPNIVSQLQQFLLKFSISEVDIQQTSFMWDQHLEN